MFKRIVSFVVTLSILVSMLNGFNISAFEVVNNQTAGSDPDIGFGKLVEETPVENFYYDTYSTYCVITGYRDSSDTNIVVPSQIDGLPVTQIGNGAFRYSYNLQNIILPEGLTYIDNYAFEGCSELVSITIPDTVDYIGNDAFMYCYNLTSIKLPAALTSISSGMFYGCEKLKSVHISSKVTEIGSLAFSGCSGLESITVEEGNSKYSAKGNCLIENETGKLILGCGNSQIPDDGSVKIIGASSFASCSGLTSIVIPDSVTKIENQAFYNSGLKSVVIPDSVTEIETYAFYYCKNLETVVLSKNLKTIPGSLFYYCTSLKSIEIPESVEKISSSAFAQCSALTSITIPAGVTSIDSSAFTGCNNLASIQVDDGNQYYTDSGNCLISKASGSLYVYTKYSTMPTDGSVKDIKNYSFNCCPDLEYLFIPASVTTIARNGLYNLNNLSTIIVDENNANYMSSGNCLIEKSTNTLYRGCKSSVIPTDGSVTVIGSFAFYNCAGLKEVVIPNTVTKISDQAFRYCSDLSKVTISDSVQEIGSSAFSDTAIESIIIPESIESLAPDVFYNCRNLTDVQLPQTLNSIEPYAFGNCSSLEEITIPDSVERIEYSAFISCENLKSIKLPSKITYIEFNTFSYCYSLEEIVIPNAVEYIGITAFSDCHNLKTVVIPLSVKNIESDAFSYCYNLSDIYYAGTEDQWNSISYYGYDLDYVTKHFGHSCEYTSTVVPPTYTEQGYTLHTCTVCGSSYKDNYVDVLKRIPLSEATIKLEYTEAFYKGAPLTPEVTVTYNGTEYNGADELNITYENNNKVGTATVTLEGKGMFEGSTTLTFEISYEVIPEKIVNVTAYSEIGKISISWGKSSEVDTDSYKIYRSVKGENDFTCIATIKGRNNLTFEDVTGEKGSSYEYYVTGVGLYDAESLPSEITTGTVLIDTIPPVVLKISPESSKAITGVVTLSVTASDNVAVEGVKFFYSSDNGVTWNLIQESLNGVTNASFNTSTLEGTSVKVKAVAYDKEGLESQPFIVAYILDNEGPGKVTGLKAECLPSKITLSWNDVSDNDASYFILQGNRDGNWVTVATNITTLGYTVKNLQPDTSYLFRVACVDIYGNIGEYSDAFNINTAKDTTAPVITNQSPASSRFNNRITYTVTVKDDCNVAKITIQTSSDGKTWTDVNVMEYSDYAASKIYSYTIDLAEYDEGSIYVRAVAADHTGNISDTSDKAPLSQYIVDKTAPGTPSGIKANGQDGYITIQWNMGTESDIAYYSLYRALSADGQYTLIASGLKTINYHDKQVDVGNEYYYKVKVSDTCGNESLLSGYTSATVNPDNEKPVIEAIGSTYMSKISEKIHVVSVAASDNNKISEIVAEFCTSNDTSYKELTRVKDINSSYKNISVELPWADCSEGDYIFLRVYAVDMAGFVSDYKTATYQIDNTCPELKNYNLSGDGENVVLSWQDSGESDLSGFRIYRSTNGINYTYLGARGVSESGNYTFYDTITAKESGSYIYKIEAVDRVENYSYEELIYDYTYVYVNKAPKAKFNIPNLLILEVEELFDGTLSSDDIAISSYLWDFGDGTTSEEAKPAKKYSELGEFTVTLTVTDNEGLTSTVSGTVQVKERESLGTLNVQVKDDSGNNLAYVPVYFDLGSDIQKVVYTDSSGFATLQMTPGTHIIGVYSSGYLPVKKEVTVLANATRYIMLTTVEEELVTGEFEVTRMTFDEIVAAGIDVYDPDNQNVYSATVRVSYGSTPPVEISYYRNDFNIISYTVKSVGGSQTIKPGDDDDDDDGNGGTIVGTTGGGGGRKFSGLGFISGNEGQEIVAVLDIPAQASFLKEFFDVRLHIINNASSDFSLDMNEVVLNVPDGMTLMDNVENGYENSNTVKIDSIRGQESKTLAWVLRGDKTGDYDLSADFTGTLSEFNQLVTTRFETETPIKVYGMDGVVFRVLAADEIHGDALYFNVELENARDVDIYMPSIGLTDKIQNVSESAIPGSEAYILNIYVENESGAKQYMPFTYDENDNVVLGIKLLSPGQKLVYEYVSYNASDYGGTSYFHEACVENFEGIFENIQVGSFEKEFYSFEDYSEKLDKILSDENPDIEAAYQYILDNSNYYYMEEAASGKGDVCEVLYKLSDLVLNGDVSIFTKEEEEEMMRKIILSILADSSMVKQVEDLMTVKYTGAVKDMIKKIEDGILDAYTEDKDTSANVMKAFASIIKDSKDLVITYKTKGSDAFKKELNKQIAGYSIGIAVDVADYLTASDENLSLSKVFEVGKDCVSAVLEAVNNAEKDRYYYALLKTQCNADVANYILDAILEATYISLPEQVQEKLQGDIFATISGFYAIYQYAQEFSTNRETDVYLIALEMKAQLQTNMDEYYEKWNYAVNMFEKGAELTAEYAIKAAMKAALGTTVFGLVSAGFNILDAVFGFESYVKQQDTFDVYSLLTGVFKEIYEKSLATRGETEDFYTMVYLRTICELRIDGEVQFRAFMDDYLNGVYATPLSEEKVVEKINDVMNTFYSSYSEWNDAILYKVVHSRDLMFNYEKTSDIIIPKAPQVSLDYDKLQTVQSFTSEYEYCFSDGAWKACDGNPISFEVGTVPSVLRVRAAAGDENFAGEITTVKIFARKNLSKLISVKFDGVNYIVENLSSKYKYQIAFVDSSEEKVNWNNAVIVSGSNGAAVISGVACSEYMVIRSMQNSLLMETTSNPLYVAVDVKHTFDLVIDGNGTVFQSDDSGRYYNGDDISLIATAAEGEEFTGWYINGECVSTDTFYLAEMHEDLQVKAVFTGATIENISIVQPPENAEYEIGEYPDLSQLEVVVTYSDGTTATAQQFATQLTSNVEGESSVLITYGGHATSFNVNIVSKVHQAIANAKQTIFTDERTVQDYINEKGVAYIYTIYVNGKQVSADRYLSTGMIITIENPLTSAIEALEVVIYGDVNGDGKILSSDYMCVKRSIVGSYALTDAKQKAADVNKDGVVNTVDYMRIKAHLEGFLSL